MTVPVGLPNAKQHDPVSNPKHYTSGPNCECGRVIECIQVTERLGFCIGNAVKYLWRSDLKGAAIEDLEKSMWYIRREIDRRAREGPR